MTPLLKQDFFGLEDQTWLFTGAESPLHHGVRAAVDEYLDHRTLGPKGREFNARLEASCRERFARLMGGETKDIALLSNASEAIASVLAALRLQPGDNIVLNTLEFPSAVLAGLALKESGVEIRLVEHRNWQVDEQELLSHVDAKTRILITSHVSYLSGARMDYKSLYAHLKNTSTLFLLDVTQSLGVVPVDMKHADFTVCSSYKWLLGMHGLGILGVNPERTSDLASFTTGWRSVEDLFSPRRFEAIERYHDARRFEIGFPAFNTVAALNFSTGLLLDTGIERIEEHVLALGGKLLQALKDRGWSVMTPEAPSQRAGNIAVVCENGEQVSQQLLEKKVLTWGGDGRLRFSIHGFNDESDIERALSVLDEVAPKKS